LSIAGGEEIFPYLRGFAFAFAVVVTWILGGNQTSRWKRLANYGLVFAGSFGIGALVFFGALWLYAVVLAATR
jgi:hypothetical protein